MSDGSVWLVKNEDGEYVSEVVPGCVYFTDKQRAAKWFTDQGKAYRLALKWNLHKVVRLGRRTTSDQSKGNP